MVCGPPLPQVQLRRHRGRARQPRVAATALRGVATACHQSAVVGPGTGFTDAAAYVGGNGLDTAMLPKRTAGADVRCPEAAGQVSEP
jgi:dTDP-L-rhamnose 4-epimerase